MDKKLFTHDLINGLGMSAYRLAINSNVAPSVVLTYIAGKAAPSIKNARRLANELNIPLDMLIFPAEEKDDYAPKN